MTDKAALLREFRRVRETGLSFDLEEYEMGVLRGGAPVQDIIGDVVSLTAVVPMRALQARRGCHRRAVARTRDEAQAALIKPAAPLTRRRRRALRGAAVATLQARTPGPVAPLPVLTCDIRGL